jgi:exodeoxyribonuclease VII small subunit
LVSFCAAELDAVGEGLKELKLDDLAAKLEAGEADPGRGSA